MVRSSQARKNLAARHRRRKRAANVEKSFYRQVQCVAKPQEIPYHRATKDVIWSIIKDGTCHTVKQNGQMFSRNPWNVSGLFSKRKCPMITHRPVKITFDEKKMRGTLHKMDLKFPDTVVRDRVVKIPLGRHMSANRKSRMIWKFDKDGKKYEYKMPKWFIKTGRHCLAAKKIWDETHGSRRKYKRDPETKKMVPYGPTIGTNYNKRLTHWAIARYHKLYRAARLKPSIRKDRESKKASKAVVDADEE